MTFPDQRVGRRQLATFVIDDLYFGVDVLRVQEILCCQQMTVVPRSSGIIEGLINLRGQIVTALNMRRRLNLPERLGGSALMNVVLCSEGGAVSLLVDDIGDVIEADPRRFEAPPSTLNSATREMIESVYKLEDRLLLVLAADQVLEV